MILFCLLLGVAQVATVDTVLAKAARAAAAFPDTAAARAQGFVPLAFGRVADLSPFQGQHWLNQARVAAGTKLVEQPSFVMFVPVGGRWQPVGLAYSVRIAPNEPAPADLAGQATPWHLHQLCFGIPGEGGALADGTDDCRARGGRPTPRQLAMVHAWTGVANPEGFFAHDNVALPYLATGLRTPTPEAVASPERARLARALGLALGETYGARMPYARRVEVTSSTPGLRDSLEQHRAVIRDLVPLMRSAESAGDQKAWDRLTSQAIAEWEKLKGLYERAAPTPEVRAQLERQHRAALGEAHKNAHHH